MTRTRDVTFFVCTNTRKKAHSLPPANMDSRVLMSRGHGATTREFVFSTREHEFAGVSDVFARDRGCFRAANMKLRMLTRASARELHG